MVTTKREDVTNQGICKYSAENSIFGLPLVLFQFFFGGGVGAGEGENG